MSFYKVFQIWRNIYKSTSYLTPVFIILSGKMKMMFQNLFQNSLELGEICKEHSQMKKPVDIKEFCLRYTTDCIVSCAFGLECNSLQNNNSEYRHFGKRLFDTQRYRQIMVYLLPEKLLHALRVKLVVSDVEKFILNLVRNTIEYREKNNFMRKDAVVIKTQEQRQRCS